MLTTHIHDLSHLIEHISIGCMYLSKKCRILRKFRRIREIVLIHCIFFALFAFSDLGQWPAELPLSFMYLVGSGVVTTVKPVRW